MKVTTITTSGKTGTATVSDAVFGVTPNQLLIAQAVRVYRANERQGTSATKTRSMVARTHKKWFKQKGTGNARHGARTAPIFVGGGIAHGPKANQNWSLKLTKQMKKVAFKSALSAQAAQIMIADELESLSGKTKEAVALLSAAQAADKRVLVVLAEMTDTAVRSLRNVENVLVVSATQVSILEVAMADVIITTTKAVALLEERLTATTTSKGAAKVAKTEAVKAVAEKPTKKVAAKPKAEVKPAAKAKAAPKTAAKKSSTSKK